MNPAIVVMFLTLTAFARDLARDFLRPVLTRRHQRERAELADDRAFWAAMKETA